MNRFYPSVMRQIGMMMTCVICCISSSAIGQESKVPKWDARGVGLPPTQGITSLDVSPDGSRITVGTIAPTGTPNVHVLDRDGKLVKSYVVNQRWIAQVAGAANDRAFALTTMPGGTAGDEPKVVACGEPSQPITDGMGGFSFFHYGDHSNHTGKLLAGFDGGAVTTNEYQVVWLDASGTTTQALAKSKATVNYRNLKTTALTAHRSGVAIVGGYASYPASEGVKAPTPTNNLFVYKPGETKPIWSRPTVDDVAPSTPPEKGEYGRPLLADGSQNPLPQRDDPVFAPLSITVSREAEFSAATRIATADYRGYQRTVRSSATGQEQVIGARFMPARPTITVYDGTGKVVRRFDSAKFDKAGWVDLALLPGGKKLIAYPHSWACRGLAGQAMLPVDDDAQTLWLLEVETGDVRSYSFPDAIANVAVSDQGVAVVSCWNGEIYPLSGTRATSPAPNLFQKVGKPAALKYDESGNRLIAATTTGEVIYFTADGKIEKHIDLNKEVPYVEQWYTSKATAAKLSDHLWELPGGRVESDLGGQRVIKAPGGLILIEGHAGLSFEREWKGIETAGLDPKQVKYILTTHEHGDHSPGAYLWRVATGAQFICSREMAYTLQHHLPDGTGYGLHPPVPVDTKIDDEVVLNLAGMKVSAIRLPGHTFGSMGWLFELDGKRWVSIGDLIMPDGRLGYAGSINFSPYQVLASLRKLDSLRVDMILPGHGPVVGPDRYVAAGIAFGSRVGWGKMMPERPDPRFRIEHDNVLVAGFLSGATSADFGDVDGDGLPDVAVVAPTDPADPKSGSMVKVYLNKTEREPRFDPLRPDFQVDVPEVKSPQRIRLRAVYREGRADLVVMSSHTNAILTPRDKPGHYDKRLFDGQELYQLRVVDRERGPKGKPVGGRVVAFGQFSGAQVAATAKDGTLRLDPLVPTLQVPYADLREVDLNGDGRLDWVSNDGSVRLRDADGKIPDAPTVKLALPGEGQWNHLGIGDVNGDRRPDVVIAQREGAVFAFHNTGDASRPFAEKPSTELQLKAKPPETVVHARDAATVEDWNGDGIHDVLFGMSQRDEVVVLLGGPRGLSLERSETIKLDFQLHFQHSVRVADFNGDGRPDLGCFAVVPGGPVTPYVWLQPERGASGAVSAKTK